MLLPVIGYINLSNNRHRRNIAVIAGVVTFLVWLLAFRDRHAELAVDDSGQLVIERSPIPTYKYVSTFRRAPDKNYENYIDSQLVNLKLASVGSKTAKAWPKFIWQTTKKVNKKYAAAVQSWNELNPEYDHRILDEKASDAFVASAFKDIPDIVHLYNTFPSSALKVDLLRYLILYLHGGVYADIDVHCRKPIGDWIKPALWSSGTDIITGMELDEPYATDASLARIGWYRGFGFVQYAIIAKPFAKPIRTAIVRILSHARYLSKIKKQKLLSSYSPADIYEVSGPGMWTDVIIDTLNYKRKDVSWAQFHDIAHPVKFATEGGAVVGLPTRYFGNGQRHSKAGDYNQADACINRIATKGWLRNDWFR
ncbi:nucleotide-diphospho-sugar transferase [Lipomyces japonicus]|uniref:nucleotide-diphospho-sugar transferase n=1 Tax=Lipomyces japonicus TaxID=56871 RepID=UPI0034CD8127